MAILEPFKGVTYNLSKVGRLDDVVAPPYDVISPSDQRWYYEKHPYNVVRLILPMEEDPQKNKYEISRDYLNRWISEGVLNIDDEPAFYIIRQQFEVDGDRKSRTGFTCIVKLEDYNAGTIIPHEDILEKPMDDRLNMLRHTQANYDSVFGLYSDETTQNIIYNAITEGPDASAVDRDGVLCELWRLTDPGLIESICRSMANKSILIADGHHRYAAALAYRNEMREKAGSIDPCAPYEYVMMTLVSTDDSGLVILPTHRLVGNITKIDTNELITQLSQNFIIKESSPAQLMNDVSSLFGKEHAFGLYNNKKAYLLVLKPDAKPEKLITINCSDALKRLDVTILHSLILEKCLGIQMQQMAKQANLSYTRNADEAIQLVDSGQYEMAFLMNPTTISEVKAVTESGDRMPQKSTFFYPKLPTGMVFRLIT